MFTVSSAMHTQGEKGVDSRAGGYFVVTGKQYTGWKTGSESKLGLKAIPGSHKPARKRLSRVKKNNTSQRHKQNELN